MSDPFSVLGVARDATDDQIKSAYRKLAMELHPDRNPGNKEAEDRFKEVGAAYDQIKDSAKRAEYDSKTRGSSFRGFEFRAHPGGMSMEDIFRNFAQAQAYAQAQAQRRNDNYTVGCTITLTDALKGCDVVLTVALPNGSRRDIRVTVPPGVENGSRLRVQGQGDATQADLPPGDLLVVVNIQHHPLFTRRGATLYSTYTVDAIDAATGTTLKLATLEGDTVEVPLEAGAQNGYRIRIAGRGMPAGENMRGDLIVTVQTSIPTALTERQMELLREVQSLRSA